MDTDETQTGKTCGEMSCDECNARRVQLERELDLSREETAEAIAYYKKLERELAELQPGT